VLIAVGECTSIDINFPPNPVPAGQQSALSHFALESYILTAPRASIISANKEGIVSLPGKRFSPAFVFGVFLIRRTLGYLAIHLLGLSAGTLVLPPSPSFFRRRQQALADKLTKRRISDAGLKPDKDLDLAGPRQTGKTATELCSYSIVWWGFLGLTKLANFKGQWGGVSRRMVRSPFWRFCSVIS
jgi:phosphatidylinositol glycan class W